MSGLLLLCSMYIYVIHVCMCNTLGLLSVCQHLFTGLCKAPVHVTTNLPGDDLITNLPGDDLITNLPGDDLITV